MNIDLMCLMKLENMSEFNFKSSVCTSREQSERLLALGLKKETADMCHRTNGMGIYFITAIDPICNPNDIPAWSLDRLRELIPENIVTGVRNQWHRVMYNSVLSYEEGDDSLVSFRGGNIYDRCISCIYWLIKEGYFNKEYLEEQNNG